MKTFETDEKKKEKESPCKETEDLEKSQMEILEWKNRIAEIKRKSPQWKSSMDVLNSRLKETKEGILELGYRTKEII